MAINLLDMLTRAISPALVKSVSDHLGESESNVQSGLALLLPTLLGGLASKASTPSGASSVFSMLTDSKVDTGLLGSLGSLLGSGQSSGIANVAGIGSSLLASLFGADKSSGIGAALAGVTGMKTGNAGSLVALAAPLVFGWLKKLIGDQGLNATRTAELLIGQKDHLAGQLEPALTTAFGLGSPARLLAGLAPAAAAAGHTVAAGGAAAATSASRWLPWLIALLLGLAALWYFFGMGSKAPTPAPTATVAPAAAFDLKSPAKVYFETGKAEVGIDGSALIKKVAGLLDKDKSIKVNITGYTDKTGDGVANQELAKNRALAVQAALVAAGVGADRIDTRPPIFVEIGANGADAEARRVEISAR